MRPGPAADNITIFTIKARRKHGNKYDYSEVDYINKRNKIKIVCPLHGPFVQFPHTHIQGHGCQKCGRILNAERRRETLSRQKQFTTSKGNNS